MKKHPIAVVIPTYNEEDYIARTLESFVNQQLPKSDYCIVVVNNGCTDNTAQTVLSLKRKYGDTEIHLIDDPQTGAGHARNTGCEFAIRLGVEILVNVDSGARYDENFLRIIKDGFDNDSLVGIVYAQDRFDEDDMNESVERLFNYHGWDKSHTQEFIEGTYRWISEQWKLIRIWNQDRFKNLTEEEYPMKKRFIRGDEGENVIESCSGQGSAYRVQAYLDGDGFDPNDKTAEDLRLARRVFDTKKWKIQTYPYLYFYESVRRYLPPVTRMINYSGLNCLFTDFGVGFRQIGAGESHDRIRFSNLAPKKISYEEFMEHRQAALTYCRTVTKYLFVEDIPKEIKDNMDFFRFRKEQSENGS